MEKSIAYFHKHYVLLRHWVAGALETDPIPIKLQTKSHYEQLRQRLSSLDYCLKNCSANNNYDQAIIINTYL